MSSILTLAGNNTSSGFYPHTIDQSLRLEDGDSPYLSRTPSSAGNRDVNTTSFWIKRGNLGFKQMIFTAGSSFPNNHDNSTAIQFLANDTFRFLSESGGSIVARLDTTRVLRDVSSWYHIVLAYESTNSTSADRIKLYINGVRETVFDSTTYPSSGVDNFFASDNVHQIGRSTTNYADCYLAEFNFIDGTALTADSFGETKDGIWVPKDTSGLTYGTNGFHLDWADSSAIGNDVSGNDNDFAVSGLVASDVVLDSPTNNFAVMNVLDQELDATTKEGNLFVTTSNAGSGKMRSTFTIPTTGKWYWEAYLNSTVASAEIGVAPQSLALKNTDQLRVGADNYTYRFGTGEKANNNIKTAYGDAIASGDVASVLFDADAGAIYFYKNGTIQNSGTAAFTSIDTSLDYCPAMGDTATSTSVKIQWNFGQDSTFAGRISAGGNSDSAGVGDFKYAVPSGAKSLCSANLPEPNIIDGSEYFNTVLYNGSGSSQAITGVGFGPSWTWLKRKNNTSTHKFMDVVRGDGLTLASNNVNQEQNEPSVFASLDADGFTVAGNTNSTNQTGGTYVAWNWLAGTSVSGNTTGSGTAKTYAGSVNTEAGFSIIKYTGNGTAGHTIPHNLGAKPSMVLFKNRDVGDQWAVYHKDILATHNLSLNLSDGKADQDNRFNDTEPTSSVMTLGTGHVVNANDEDYIAYFFTDIDQYCKAGVYSGNGNADGTFIFTGFRPAWVMIKRTDASADWWVLDNKRNSSNVVDLRLRPNESSAEEGPDATFDFVANGLKIRGNYSTLNNSSGNYIYLAFAEQPFKYANAR